MTIQDTILELRDVTVSFDMERGISKVVNDVDLDIRREEIIGIVGESGSGKSMLASALLDAVVEPGQVSGEITYYPSDGDPIDLRSLSPKALKSLRWEEISMVFQGAMSSFNPTKSIEGHFKETLKAHDADINAGMDRTRQLLRDMYLNPGRVLEMYPHELSGGMKQRTLIALSLVLEPEVLVMDEPTSALDLLMQRSILTLLRDLQEKYDLTLVFVTHDLPLVSKLADRLAVMYAFELVEHGATRDLLTDSMHPYTRALLRATPNLNSSIDNMQTVEGSSPDPMDLPAGCSYHPRCPLANGQCERADPELVAQRGEHHVACHHWERADEAIPFSVENPSEVKNP
jgi:oligopeptide/dipeptide ABC transporter ATP-binding protein